MEENKTQPKQLKQQGVTISQLIYVKKKGTKEIERIKFNTAEGNIISWKEPHVTISTFNGCVGIEEEVAPTKEKLLEVFPVFKEIEDILITKKKVNIICDYYEWEQTNNEGETYKSCFFRDWNIPKITVTK